MPDQANGTLDAVLLHNQHRVPLRAKFSYTIDDPWAITVDFMGGDEPVRWTFARELLMDALLDEGTDTGVGDVRAWCSGQTVLLGLSSPFGSAHMELSLAAVSDFLDATYTVVRSGDEYLVTAASIDDGLLALLGGE